MQGGDFLNIDAVTKGARTQEIYNTEQKPKAKCLAFSGQNGRSSKQSIFYRDPSFNVETYDTLKLRNGYQKTTVGSEKYSSINIEKQTERDFKMIIKASVGDRFANIQRENDKADYLKKLLQQAQ